MFLNALWYITAIKLWLHIPNKRTLYAAKVWQTNIHATNQPFETNLPRLGPFKWSTALYKPAYQNGTKNRKGQYEKSSFCEVNSQVTTLTFFLCQLRFRLIQYLIWKFSWKGQIGFLRSNVWHGCYFITGCLNIKWQK